MRDEDAPGPLTQPSAPQAPGRPGHEDARTFGAEAHEVSESEQARIDGLLANLNPPQQEAVTHGDGPLLIFAGAGSGKTRVLTARIAYLIASRRVWPDRLLAVTFTNKAAREMRLRVESLVGEQARRMWVGTFHASAVRILRREASSLGITPSFVIFDDDDTRAALKRVLDELRLDPKR
jgi:DNA helicase II / ATP-dependent DNA helicase PcrA